MGPERGLGLSAAAVLQAPSARRSLSRGHGHAAPQAQTTSPSGAAFQRTATLPGPAQPQFDDVLGDGLRPFDCQHTGAAVCLLQTLEPCSPQARMVSAQLTREGWWPLLCGAPPMRSPPPAGPFLWTHPWAPEAAFLGRCRAGASGRQSPPHSRGSP